MKTALFTDKHIIAILMQTKVGSPVTDPCREHISYLLT
jgi:hypothetical protein